MTQIHFVPTSPVIRQLKTLGAKAVIDLGSVHPALSGYWGDPSRARSIDGPTSFNGVITGAAAYPAAAHSPTQGWLVYDGTEVHAMGCQCHGCVTPPVLGLPERHDSCDLCGHPVKKGVTMNHAIMSRSEVHELCAREYGYFPVPNPVWGGTIWVNEAPTYESKEGATHRYSTDEELFRWMKEEGGYDVFF
jgi:hypothetical protein